MLSTKKKRRLVQTSIILLVMINTGFNIGIFSPTFPDVEVLTSSDTAQMSTTLVWTGVASIVGVLVIGPLFGRFDGLLLMTACLLLEGVAMALAPTWPSLTAFQALASLTCVFNFAIMSGCLTVNRGLWKTSVIWYGPVIQTTDLMHAIGTAMIPQVIKPFIAGSHAGHEPSTTTASNATWYATSVEASSTPPNVLGGFLPVQMAYLVVAVSDGIMAVVCLVACLWGRSTCCVGEVNLCQRDDEDDDIMQLLPDSVDTPAASDADDVDTHSKLEPCSRPSVVLLVLVYLMFVVNGGRDALLTGLLFTYVEEYLKWTVAAGTLMVTMYHVTRVAVHAILVPLSRWVSPTRLTIFNLVALVVASALMLSALVAGGGSDALTAAGVIVTGVATSNVHPTTITLVDETVHVVAPVMAAFISAIGLGQIVVAPLSGKLLQTAGVASFPAMLAALTLAGLLLFIVYCVQLRLLKLTLTGRHRVTSIT